MKKTYIIPKMDVVMVTAQNLLAGSIGKGTTPTSAAEADGRYDDFDWEDEE